MDRQQVNVRLTQELAAAIDQKRVELQSEMGRIPTRSDVIRLALEFYLERTAASAGVAKGSR